MRDLIRFNLIVLFFAGAVCGSTYLNYKGHIVAACVCFAICINALFIVTTRD